MTYVQLGAPLGVLTEEEYASEIAFETNKALLDRYSRGVDTATLRDEILGTCGKHTTQNMRMECLWRRLWAGTPSVAKRLLNPQNRDTPYEVLAKVLAGAKGDVSPSSWEASSGLVPTTSGARGIWPDCVPVARLLGLTDARPICGHFKGSTHDLASVFSYNGSDWNYWPKFMEWAKMVRVKPPTQLVAANKPGLSIMPLKGLGGEPDPAPSRAWIAPVAVLGLAALAAAFAPRRASR